jgi:hypothetical protein
MKIEQAKWTATKGWEPNQLGKLSGSAQLIILFGSTLLIKNKERFEEIRSHYPNASLWGCTTAGEIFDTQVSDNSLSVTVVQFEKTEIKLIYTKINSSTNSYDSGIYLAKSLPKEGLVHVLVLSDGLQINGSELVQGLTKELPSNVTVTGGLSGDGDRFKETYVLCNGDPEAGAIAVLGLYSDHLRIGYGSLGGWNSFGPERLVTKSRGNVLYEFDNKSALELYKKYLGDQAAGLPATGLLYPLSIRTPDGETSVVRTILGVDEKEQSMTFAGDIPQGSYARLMKANFDRLIDGAIGAAKVSQNSVGSIDAQLALLISCVGRKMVLKQRIEEEVEGVRDVLGKNTYLTGFYSYGEISPFTQNAKCELHNQTMTITTITEV